ncbi:hypothetical protein [Sporosarcina jiandibaonis]|uniref:hypothetical protein n=1 Tax=Sporosarcina jiandibaonis TaxID=2715535 RepID=UPI0015571F1B|nr:hypothetical protein [Sporosarcina jiandibaonis]
MTNLQQLYAERERLKRQKATGVASAMKRHQEIEKLQKEIDYYELGDNISRAQIQEELAEIETLQEEVNRLTAVVAERRRVLAAKVFGEHTAI